jgi:hypothetical protein
MMKVVWLLLMVLNQQARARDAAGYHRYSRGGGLTWRDKKELAKAEQQRYIQLRKKDLMKCPILKKLLSCVIIDYAPRKRTGGFLWTKGDRSLASVLFPGVKPREYHQVTESPLV